MPIDTRQKNMGSMRPAVGFVSAPDWHDPAPDEFRVLTNGKVDVQQTFFGSPDHDYANDSIAGCEPDLTHAARHLASAGCSIIASPATPFGFIGHQDISEARARLKRISEACGADCISSISAIIEILEVWQVRKVALACTYYPDDWRDLWSEFVANSGFEVLSAKSLINQGIKGPPTSGIVEYPTSPEIVESVSQMTAECPEAEVIVVNGSGARTVAITEELRDTSGKRIVAADTALFKAIGDRLEVDVPLPL